MTEPTDQSGQSGQQDSPEQPQGSTGRRRGSAAAEGVSAAAPVDRFTVVEYTHRDPLLGGEHRAIGVVAEVGTDTVRIRPLAHHSVQADLADVLPLTAGDADDTADDV